MMLIMAALMAPNIFAMNRGKVLRNIAIWLAIFVGLGLFYQLMSSATADRHGARPRTKKRPRPRATTMTAIRALRRRKRSSLVFGAAAGLIDQRENLVRGFLHHILVGAAHDQRSAVFAVAEPGIGPDIKLRIIPRHRAEFRGDQAFADRSRHRDAVDRGPVTQLGRRIAVSIIACMISGTPAST